MRKYIIIGFAALILVLSGCEQEESISFSEEDIITDQTINENIDGNYLESDDTIIDYGSLGAISQESFTIEAMLIYALEDEYAARTEYEYILTNFDVTTPFSNIIMSEENHISMLLPLFETYNIDVISDESSEHLIIVNDLQETYETGVIAEEYNIAMYELFLSQDNLPDDLADVFTRLRDASINHLNAFLKNADKK